MGKGPEVGTSSRPQGLARRALSLELSGWKGWEEIRCPLEVLE